MNRKGKKMKRFSIGLQHFKILRKGNGIYVDKTKESVYKEKICIKRKGNIPVYCLKKDV
jgi:hypothetical protein